MGTLVIDLERAGTTTIGSTSVFPSSSTATELIDASAILPSIPASASSMRLLMSLTLALALATTRDEFEFLHGY